MKPDPSTQASLCIIVMGVAGSGKTTLAREVARALDAAFLDADDFHPPANIEKITRGIGLDDQDRLPWLESISRTIAARRNAARPVVLACSALKESYRKILAGEGKPTWVFLDIPRSSAAARLAARSGHFAGAALVESQFADLQEPRDALRLDAHLPVESLTATVLEHLRNPSAQEIASPSVEG